MKSAFVHSTAQSEIKFCGTFNEKYKIRILIENNERENFSINECVEKVRGTESI